MFNLFGDPDVGKDSFEDMLNSDFFKTKKQTTLLESMLTFLGFDICGTLVYFVNVQEYLKDGETWYFGNPVAGITDSKEEVQLKRKVVHVPATALVYKFYNWGDFYEIIKDLNFEEEGTKE